ncbi:integrin alpha-M isoform X2 [Etheostoma spectabile]|uniref:integrin alpha-M isoform X2 n=1 Tax=Etheostoma spectabile TaxID=54343 RepID=UPI0013AF6C18|nr:integrin alpha-M-like isoform X2 [Etheostoma spectabile]
MGKMHGQRHIFLLTFMVAVAIPVSLAFNIDITNPDVYTGEQKDFFGYKVLQFMNGMNKGIIVTAPLQLNGSGGICKPDQNQTTKCFNPEDTKIPVKHLGLSIAEDSKRSQFTVCSPSVVRECYGNSYMNSVCYNITDHLEPISNFTSAFQECEKKTVDLVFLFDGSASMGEGDFKKNKDFIVDIIQELLKNSSIKFAAVQFSSDYRKVFDFNEYQRGEYLTKLEKEGHMNTLTNTHKALTFVFKEIFKNPDAGASADATKVLVLITDGVPSDSDYNNTVKKYDDANIIRFVIGVGNMANLTKFKGIASEPIGKYAFKIDNYDGLTGILINFQKKIFTMEGSKVARAGEMTNEMSQSGFSAVFYKDNLILGSVGSNSWRGSLQELNGEKETQIEDPDMPMDSYMGYSTAVGEKDHAPLYFTGAPRFEHIGQVVLFTHDGTNWTTTQRINGEQIGSYFGAELCSVDVNSDGNTDFLLVGAPLFYQPQEKKEGQIHIYTLTDEMKLESKLTVTAPSMGRFGTTISSLADLNGDGLRDVAVGAPLQDFNRGAVYIYLGDRHRGIRSTFSQRIMGEKIKPGLRFFGQSIAGNIDLGKDGLPDIVVGSQGTAVVLRSRPIFNITTRLSFEPNEISTEKIDCLDNTDANLPMVTLQACFEIAETTKSKAAAMDLGLNISYTLEVDANRQTNRGFFSQTAKKARNLTSTYELRDPDTCFNYTIYMPKCVKDTLLPIIIKLNFSQVDSESASAVLNMDSKTQAVVQVPFEKQCRKNDICIAELEVDFNFMTPTLLVAENKYFNVSVTLSNYGDDSYYTSLIMHYPPGLSFSRMTLTKATRPTLHSCEDLHGEREKTICNVSPPVFRSKSSATFRISFHILKDYEWNDTMLMTITGKSDNANRTISQTKNIPVQFEIKMAVAVKEDLVTYLNFTPEDAGPKQMVAIYKIDNLGFKDFPVNVSLFFPTKLEHNFEMTNYQVFVQQNKTQCTGVTIMTSDYCLPEKNCKFIVCDSFTLKRESPIEITLSGDVHFKDLKKHAMNIGFLKKYTGDTAEVKFKSFIYVNYDKQRYVLNSYKQEPQDNFGFTQKTSGHIPTEKMTEVRVEFTIPPDKVVIIATGVAMGLLLLLIITVIMFKLGCFKRKTLEYCEGQEEETAPQDGIPAKSTTGTTVGICSHSETDSKSDQPSEHQSLLDDGEANCSTSSVQSKEELE